MGTVKERLPPLLRENAPLLGVVLVLLCAFVALALFVSPSGRERMRPAQSMPVPILAELPASAEDNQLIVSQLAPDKARAANAAVPFAAESLTPAPRFAFRGTSADRARARQCLALAALAEAGSGDPDQRAVMQVVLNRVRHPAFANTVCGVVFEGSERVTGCQFSFTCDGSLARTYPEALWSAARQRAEEALGGRVYAPVGNATHYHTDWVYPWWSNQLDKIARVGTHLFFRWRGFWGTPAALSARYAGGEPDPTALREEAVEIAEAAIVPSLADSGEAVRTITAEPDPADEPNPAGSPQPGVHFVIVSASDSPTQIVERARALCPGDRYCQVYGWDGPGAIPARLPLGDEARAALRFSFLPARGGNAPAVYFDCGLFEPGESGRCLPRARP